MLSFPVQAPICLSAGVCDMDKSFNGLLDLIHQAGIDDPLWGAWFVFRNRQGDKLKSRSFDRDGLAIWDKRLEKGRFQWPPNWRRPGFDLNRCESASLAPGGP
jgi:transposase